MKISLILLTSSVLTSFLSLLGSAHAADAKLAAGKKSVSAVVYKSPTCGCCSKWEDHLKKNGFTVESKVTEDMARVKQKQNVPQELASCHTAVIGGYVIEGHVPASAIHRLLKEKPAGVKGLTVPGMPIGSPGMEGPNPEKYQVLTLGPAQKPTVFGTYRETTVLKE